MQCYVVTSGLSRRLVEAWNPDDAREVFCKDHPIRRAYAHLDELLEIHVATPDEIAEFEKRARGVVRIAGQGEFELGDARRSISKLKRSGAKKDVMPS